MDTIAALASPSGESAIGIIRLSGPGAWQIGQAAMQTDWRQANPRQARLVRYTNLKGQLVDQLIALPYPAGHSYTGEAMLELMPHGNPLILERILADLVERGARLAEPGEFTRRAFLAGKMDLTQAEGVLDLIRARSDHALEAAQRQLSGSVGRFVQSLVEELLTLSAQLEAYIDFPEEDLPPETEAGPVKALISLQQRVQGIIATQHYHRWMNEGVRVVLIGAPNAGKSSLFNAILEEERVLVSPEPGTTRDFIEAQVRLGSHIVRLIDTAGLRVDAVGLEQRGIERTLAQLDQADLVIFVADQSQPYPTLAPDVHRLIERKPSLLVLSKADLVARMTIPPTWPDEAILRTSAPSQAGIAELRQQLLALLQQATASWQQAEVVVSARHATALQAVTQGLAESTILIQKGEPAELAATELRLTLDALEQIVGRIDNERMLDALFGQFCIGK